MDMDMVLGVGMDISATCTQYFTIMLALIHMAGVGQAIADIGQLQGAILSNV